jgi:hypothetical protein
MPPQTRKWGNLFEDEEKNEILSQAPQAPAQQTKKWGDLFSEEDDTNSKTIKDLSPEERKIEKEGFWDSMPLWYKQGYNESLGGMIHEIMNGKKYYDISNAPPSWKRDIGAGLVSFFASKEDLALMVGTLGAGTLVAKGAQKAVGKQMVSALTKKRAGTMLTRGGKLTKKQAQGVIDDVVELGAQQGFMLGTHDGLYEAAREVRDDIIVSGKEFPELKDKKGPELWGAAFKEIMKASDPMDYAKGFGLGITGSASRTGRWFLKGPHKKGSQMAGFMFEGATFGGLAPVLYEGRAPTAMDFIMTAGVVGAITLPGTTIQRIRRTHSEKLSSEFSRQQEFTMRKQSAEYGRHKSEDIKLTPLTEEKAPVIRGINVALKDAMKDAAKKEGKKPGRTPKTAINARDVAIDQSTIKWKKDGTVTFDVHVGRGKGKGPGNRPARIRLDAKNSEKLLTYYVEDPRAYRDLVKRTKITRGTKFESVRLNRLLEDFEQKAKGRGKYSGASKKRDGLRKSDWDSAIDYMIAQGSSRLRALKKKGEITASQLTNSERAILARRIDDSKHIRLTMEKYYPEYNKNQLYNPAGTPNSEKGIFSSAFAWLRPAYDAVDDLYAKKAIRMLEEVDVGARNKTSERYGFLDKLFSMADGKSSTTQKWFKGWYSGTNKTNNAFIWFKTMTKEAKDLPVGKQKAYFEKIMKKEEAKIAKLTGDKKEKQQLKVDFLKGWKSWTDDIYKDAKNSGIKVASYIDFYMPNMLRKPVLDILFEPLKELDDKVMQLISTSKKGGAEVVPNLDGYSGGMQKKLNTMIREWVKGYEKKAKKKGMPPNHFTAIFNSLKKKNKSGRDPDEFEVYMAIKQGFHNNVEKVFAPLERERRLGASKISTSEFNQNLFTYATDIFDRDLSRLAFEYTAGSTKRIEMAKGFGANYEFFHYLTSKIGDNKRMAGLNLPQFMQGRASRPTEKLAVETLKDTFLGDINFKNPLNAAKILQSASNLEMTFKIASGFATIPNMTQVMISTMLRSPMSVMKATVNLAINSSKGNQGSIRQWVKDSGAVIMSAFDDLLSSNVYTQTGAAAKLLDKTPTGSVIFKLLSGKGEMSYRDAISFMAQKSAKWSGFRRVNEINNILSAATGEQLMIKFARIIKGKKTGIGILDTIAPNKRKAWAIENLKKFGLTEKDVLKYGDNIINRVYNKKLAGERAMRKKVMRGMTNFAIDTQQQRSFVRDPLVFNDPMWKPLFLFKRFGYRQSLLIKREVEEQIAYGNVMPLLQLAVGGFLGGQFVMWAKDQYQKILTGEEQYFGRNNRAKLLTMDRVGEIGWQDLINAYANVGAFGVVGDVMSAEDPASAIDFFVTPVMIDDFERVFGSDETDPGAIAVFMDGWMNDYDEINAWDIPLRKGLKKISPMFGGIPSRFVRLELETEEMTRNRIKGYKRTHVEYIRTLIEEGRIKQALEQAENFNRTYALYEVERLGIGFDKETGLSLGTKMIFRDDNYLGYPSMAITPKDFSPRVMMQRWMNRTQKLEKERTKRP